MNTVRSVRFAFVALLLAFGSATAQQSGKIPRIGYLTGTGDANDPGPFFEAFRQALQTQGYIEGKNILIEHRYVKGRVEQIPNIVSQLVQLNVDALVLGQLQAIRAAKDQTTTIPIVMVTTVDPVTSGLIKSFSHPDSNLTGVALLARELNGKRLELLKEVVPRASSVGVLFGDGPKTAGVAQRNYSQAFPGCRSMGPAASELCRRLEGKSDSQQENWGCNFTQCR